MTQALMPGDEPIEIKFKPKEQYVAPTPPPVGYNTSGAVDGCNCPPCQQARQEECRAEMQRAMNPPSIFNWESEPVQMGDFFDSTAMSRFP